MPGTIVPHADRIAHVSVKLSGTVAELSKNIGDDVVKDEVVAVLESREVADANVQVQVNATKVSVARPSRVIWPAK